MMSARDVSKGGDGHCRIHDNQHDEAHEDGLFHGDKRSTTIATTCCSRPSLMITICSHLPVYCSKLQRILLECIVIGIDIYIGIVDSP
jgi:hypothetical protein